MWHLPRWERNMKKLFKLLTIACLLLSLFGCNKKENKDTNTVQVDKELLDVTITIPASWYEETNEEITQSSLDEQYKNSGFKSVTLNDDSSVTMVIPKSVHKEFMEDMKNNIDESLSELINDENCSYTEIKHNKDFTQFDVTLSGSEPNFYDSFGCLSLYLSGAMYNIFNGTESNDILINLYDPNGNLVDTYNGQE